MYSKHMLLLGIFAFSLFAFPQTSAFSSNHADPSPNYRAWSAAALERVELDFPNAAVVDFLFIGCKPMSESATNYIFKFWLRQGPDEFGAYVTVTVNMPAQRAVRFAVEKTDLLIPSYGKWIVLTKHAVLKRYPGAERIDVRPYECKWLSKDRAKQTYLFWVKYHGKEMLVLASVVYSIQTETIINVELAPKRELTAPIPPR
ncbi:DUF3889 domain-containing protein [Paenibacillus thermotolerans]|uniref:DUF3889 domain-containing protein n=1 Tax=Paenibacillus thermotolerans TaxID=3027807 RepID=UPI002367B89C|nr:MULTISPECIES: DUF3889 domain-containing protein [unclassified Paenibacillus]